MCQFWCSSMQGISAQLMGGRSASRSVKFGVVVFKASMIDWGEVDLLVDHAKFGVAVFKASVPNCGVGGSSAMGICALCYIWNLFGVMVFQTSMLNWRRGWCQSAMGIWALCYIWNLFCVMVFQRSLLNWRRGVGSVSHGILLYVKLLWCMGLPWVYVHCVLCETYGVWQCCMDLWSIGRGKV